jgi:hypothetical protein
MLMALVLFLAAACDDGDRGEDPSIDDDDNDDDNNDDTGPSPDDDDDNNDNDDNDNDDDDNNDDNDDNDDDNDDNDDDDTIAPIFDNPHDGRLYAAAGMVTITPTDENHPCPKYLGGTYGNRLAEFTRDDLEARVLLLEQDGVHLVLVSADLVGLLLPDVEKIMDALAPYGVDRDHVIFSSTHSHEAPDTIGIWGSDYFHTGRCATYIQFLVQAVTDKVIELAATMVPVTVALAETSVYVEGASEPNQQTDFRMPRVCNEHLTTAWLRDADGLTVATVVNWSNHPEVIIWLHGYSADFPRYTRQKLETLFGGTSVYFSGTVGGLMTPLDMTSPQYTPEGEQVFVGGEPVFIGGATEEQMWSVGFMVADFVAASLAAVTPVDGNLAVNTQRVEIPIINPAMVLAMIVGLIEPYRELITDKPWFCGLYGCFAQSLHHVQFGAWHIVSLPGEAFSETAVGREETSFDWGEPWGVFTYPAMTGYRAALPAGKFLMDIGLANNETGYLVPATDLYPFNHPDYYEEGYCIAPAAEGIVREAITNLLSARAAH